MVYIGIDPGISGGCLAAIYSDGFGEYTRVATQTTAQKKATEQQLWDWFCQFIGEPCYAIIEQQTARPTFVPRLGKPTILASTCYLYGSYCQLRAMLVAANIAHQICPPKRWQKWLGIPKRINSQESSSDWKNRLKNEAKRIYCRDKIMSGTKESKITLGNCDGILIAGYAKYISELLQSSIKSHTP